MKYNNLFAWFYKKKKDFIYVCSFSDNYKPIFLIFIFEHSIDFEICI